MKNLKSPGIRNTIAKRKTDKKQITNICRFVYFFFFENNTLKTNIGTKSNIRINTIQ